MKEIWTADREAGNKIEKFDSIEQALAAIDCYESDDRKEGIYTTDFYDVVDQDGISLLKGGDL